MSSRPSGGIEHVCPRRGENPGPFRRPEIDTWDNDDSCSYCGSLDPYTLMERIEAGTVALGATDKNYKVYVHNAGGAQFKQNYRDCPREGRTCTGPDDCTHWVTRESDETKFYFQHLNEEQKLQFVELLNNKKLKFEGGQGLYVLPFFCSRQEKKTA